MGSVDLGPDSWKIFDQATKGQLDPDKLHLCKQGKKWKLLHSEEVPEGSHISGKNLMSLIKAAATGQKEIPKELENAIEDKEFKNITSDQRFRHLCELIPADGGADSSVTEARAARQGRIAALMRTFKYAKTVGKGFERMARAGLEGRFVGQGTGTRNEVEYLINELVLRGKTVNEYTANEVQLMKTFWETTTSSIHPLPPAQSFVTWVREKENEWKILTDRPTDKQGFLAWLAEKDAECKYREDFFNVQGHLPTEKETQMWRDRKDDRLTQRAAELSAIVDPKIGARKKEGPMKKAGESAKPAVPPNPYEGEEGAEAPEAAAYEEPVREKAPVAPNPYEGEEEAEAPEATAYEEPVRKKAPVAPNPYEGEEEAEAPEAAVYKEPVREKAPVAPNPYEGEEEAPMPGEYEEMDREKKLQARAPTGAASLDSSSPGPLVASRITWPR